MRREATCFIQVIQIVPIIGVTDTSITSWGGELSAEVHSSSFANFKRNSFILRSCSVIFQASEPLREIEDYAKLKADVIESCKEI
jgi:hypothetical protein